MSNGSPPITPAPVPPSVPGVPQPVFGSGSPTTPAPPIPITGTPVIPPPPMANPVGVPVFPPVSPATAPVAVPVGPLVGPAVPPTTVPPSIAGIPQPTFGSGSGTLPVSMFPLFSTSPPSPPVVYANIFNMGNNKPPPTTPGQNPPPIMPATPPVNTVAPVASVISPPLAVGSQIVCSVGSWSGNPSPAGSYTRQWYSMVNAIPGATGSSYTAQASDVGSTITCVVTATNFVGSASATSNAIGPVPAPLRAEASAAPASPAPANRKRRAA